MSMRSQRDTNGQQTKNKNHWIGSVFVIKLHNVNITIKNDTAITRTVFSSKARTLGTMVIEKDDCNCRH